MTTTIAFDLAALVAALEADDPARIAAAYADDAIIEIHNRDHGPSAPLVVRGHDAVRALLEDVASRELEHRVRRAVADTRCGALQIRCRYPDGATVTCSTAFDIEHGRIVRETRLEIWDA
ncbi:MAG TPA: nuclear transport factor 2 family protein [Solirubrobacteraceae bacterium]|nr:nuclear transport factor 2 family protein [Solirubrobacteraceae bacterium]